MEFFVWFFFLQFAPSAHGSRHTEANGSAQKQQQEPTEPQADFTAKCKNLGFLV